MKYIIYEIRKVTGIRYIMIFTVLLFVTNIAIAYYTANINAKWQIPPDIISEFFDKYKKIPEQIEAEYEELLELNEEQHLFWIEALQRGEYDYLPEHLPNKYTDSDWYDDFMFFNEIFNRKNYISDYSSIIQRVIDRAYENIEEFNIMGISSDSYAYKYQLKIIELYTYAKSEVKIVFEYNHGWQEFFTYDIVNIFIFSILVVVGSVIFAQEKSSGFLTIIKTAKNGRTKTAFAKIGAMLILTDIIILVFTFSTLGVFGIIIGLSSPNNAIQVFQDFLLSPAVVTVGQYLLITLAIKFLVFSLFSCIILLISVFIHNYALIYLCGFGIFGLNFLLYTIRFIDADNPVRNLNFIAVAAVKPLYVRYRAINLFENLYGYIPFMIVTFSIFLCVVSILTIIVFNKGKNNEVGRLTFFLKISYKIKKILLNIINKISSFLPKKRTYSISIFFAEIYKTLISKRYVLIIIVLFLIKGYISNDIFAPLKTYSDAVYKEYMTILEGEVTGEKLEYIANERENINFALVQKDVMLDKYLSEEIDYWEYREYLQEYNYAYARNEIFKIIENHLYYIEQIKTQKNIDTWFVYDTGWGKLFHNNFDIILYLAILLLFSGIFADEYTSKSSSGGFAQILKATKHGRKRTFTSKFTSAVTITALMTVIFNVLDFILIWKNYDLPVINAPLLSIQSFAAINGDIMIIQYIAVYFLTRLFANILFAAFVCGLSELLKKTVFVMSVSVALTLFPALFAYFGLGVFSYFDFTELLSATQIYLMSARTGLFGDTGLFIIFTVCCTLISCGILLKSEKDYVK